MPEQYTMVLQMIKFLELNSALDGAGDNICSSVTYVNKKGVWNKIAETPLESSLRNIYSFTTKFLE